MLNESFSWRIQDSGFTPFTRIKSKVGHTMVKTRAIVVFILVLILAPIFSIGQPQHEIGTPERKRLISKVEIFAGPGLSFNHGNKFIENYKDKNVTNRRLLKPGYVVGIGAYHSLSPRFDLNVRLQYEQKGTRNELNTPSLPNDNRQIDYFNYSYKYLSVTIAPNLIAGVKKRVIVSLGIYYNKAKEIVGDGRTYDTHGTIKSGGSYKGRFFMT